MAHSHDHDLLTVTEVAHQLRVDDTTVHNWIRKGALEAITLPHTGRNRVYRVRRATLDLLLNRGGASHKEDMAYILY